MRANGHTWNRIVRTMRAGAAGCLVIALLATVSCGGSDKHTETTHQSGSAASGGEEGRSGQADAMTDRDAQLASEAAQDGSQAKRSEPRRPTGGSDRARGSSVVDQPTVGRPR